MSKKIAALILAAGKGTRMNDGESSPIPKTLFKLHGRPMIDHVHELLCDAGLDDIYVMVGYKREMIEEYLGDKVFYIPQEEINGTGYSLQVAEPHLRKYEKILVINGDTPFFSGDTINKMLGVDGDMVLASSELDAPTGYGRIIREGDNVMDIREEKDATKEEREIREVNAGCYVFTTHWLEDAVSELTQSPSGEYYITELPKIANKKGLCVKSYVLGDSREALGINTREELISAHELI